MIEIIDIDKLFDGYISDYVYRNIGKVKPEEIENRMPVLYTRFGDSRFKELGEKTPNTFYRGYPAAELIGCLKEHIKKGVPVSDFLCEAITDADGGEAALAEELENDNDEELTLYLMNMLGEKNSDAALKRYIQFVMWDYTPAVRELATELLCGFADTVKEELLAEFANADENRKACLTEILSHCSKDDRVFDLLVDQFLNHGENIPLYSGYLARYGDERALPFLTEAIERENINYGDFGELRFAIEALGGEYKGTRDFSSDSVYRKVKKASAKHKR